jgi:hypothetical protein
MHAWPPVRTPAYNLCSPLHEQLKPNKRRAKSTAGLQAIYILPTFLHGVLVFSMNIHEPRADLWYVRAAVPVVWMDGLYCGRHYNVGIKQQLALGRRPLAPIIIPHLQL